MFQMKLKEIESMTPWEQYLAKKKEKRKAKKQKSKNEKDEEDDKPFSDDDLPDGIDPDDPFFKNTEDKDDSQKNKKKKKGKKNVGNKEEVWICSASAVWPDKNRQMSIKVPQNGFTRKMNDFDTFTKIA